MTNPKPRRSVEEQGGFGAPPFFVQIGDQNRWIVPIEFWPGSHYIAPPYLNVDAVAPRGAGLDLVQQFGELRRCGRCLVVHAQPMAQHVGLPGAAQALQRGNLRRQAHSQGVVAGQFLQQLRRLRRMRCGPRKGGAKRWKGGLQHGQQLDANAVAGKALVGVGWVFHPGLPLLAQPVAHIGRRHP